MPICVPYNRAYFMNLILQLGDHPRKLLKLDLSKFHLDRKLGKAIEIAKTTPHLNTNSGWQLLPTIRKNCQHSAHMRRTEALLANTTFLLVLFSLFLHLKKHIK